MFRILAPLSGPYITTVLPSPELGDQTNTIGEVGILKSMDGTLYTTKKSRGKRKRMQWGFKISLEKALELKAFFKVFYSSPIKIVDHLDKTWVGYFTSNPFSFTDFAKLSGPQNDEYTHITLTFEEK